MSESGRIKLWRLDTQQWLAWCFGSFLFLSVLTPEVIYKTFFHAAIYPLSLYIVFRKPHEIIWSDPFLRLFLLFCGYMAMTTWLVGNGPDDRDAQALRWGLEAALGMLAFSLWMPAVVARAVLWGRIFLLAALIGGLTGLLSTSLDQFDGSRLAGLGAMGHPIQGASILIVFMAIGLFLLLRVGEKIGRLDTVLATATVLVALIFVTLTGSRAPIMALAVYLVFLAWLVGCRYRPAVTVTTIFVLILGALCLVHGLVGLNSFYDQLLARGTSYRLDIWRACLSYPPESLLIGNGAGLDFRFTEASRLHLIPQGLLIDHPHNLWLGVLSDTGLIGVLLQAGLVGLPVWAVWRSRCTFTAKLHLLGILGLFLMLTFTDEYTLLISLHPVWLFGWIPLVFVWMWSRLSNGNNKSAFCQRAGGEQ